MKLFSKIRREFLPCTKWRFPVWTAVTLDDSMPKTFTVGDNRNITSSHCPWFLPFVLSLARMELIFFIAAHMVFCIAFGAKTVLITYRCFGYC